MIRSGIRGNATGTKNAILLRCLTANSVRLMTMLVAMMTIACGAQATTQKGNLPYTTIDHPDFIAASQVTFLSKDDLVMGVSDGKVSKAYPLGILAQHGVVQDKLPDAPIAVTF